MEVVMPLLQIRDVPTELYEKISKVAYMENRSIAQQTIVLLNNALNITDERIIRRKAVLQEIDTLNIKNANKFPNPEKLIREDRDR
jgi:Fe-S cluster biosynthesis and repair protein YggX